jgi:hypothetical protein
MLSLFLLAFSPMLFGPIRSSGIVLNHNETFLRTRKAA